MVLCDTIAMLLGEVWSSKISKDMVCRYIDGALLGIAVSTTYIKMFKQLLLVSIPATPTRSCISHYSGNREQLRYSIMSGVDYEEFLT